MNKLLLTAAVAAAAAIKATASEATPATENLVPDESPPPLPEGCERDPRQDPRIGDMLHVRVLQGEKRPKPMTVIDVTKYKVYWKRGGERCNTELRLWKSIWIIQHAEVLAVATVAQC